MKVILIFVLALLVLMPSVALAHDVGSGSTGEKFVSRGSMTIATENAITGVSLPETTTVSSTTTVRSVPPAGRQRLRRLTTTTSLPTTSTTVRSVFRRPELFFPALALIFALLIVVILIAWGPRGRPRT